MAIGFRSAFLWPIPERLSDKGFDLQPSKGRLGDVL
jgi:hypothetical protein